MVLHCSSYSLPKLDRHLMLMSKREGVKFSDVDGGGPLQPSDRAFTGEEEESQGPLAETISTLFYGGGG